MKRLSKALVAVMVSIPMLSHAGFKTGNDIYKDLMDTDSVVAQMYVLGFIAGVHDSFSGDSICTNTNVTAGQLRDIVKKYLQERPEMRDLGGAILVLIALAQAFPCAKKKGNKS